MDQMTTLEAALKELAERKAKALELYKTEPEPTRTGESAGSRLEGRQFRASMAEYLAFPGYEIHTAIGKSSNGRTLDGNAHERLAFKMLSFKTSALQSDLTLVIALNHAFAAYDPHFFAEIVGMAAGMNATGTGGAVVVLGTPRAYDAYFERLERELRRRWRPADLV